eukprot:6474459-Lingulodinium_polyedra.AAC.1
MLYTCWRARTGAPLTSTTHASVSNTRQRANGRTADRHNARICDKITSNNWALRAHVKARARQREY